MPISKNIKETMTSKGAGVIRKMFEEGIRLKAQYGNDKVFDFSIGNPDLEPPADVKESMERNLAKCREKNFHGYMPNAGFAFCRDAMAEKTSLEQGVKVTGATVHIVNEIPDGGPIVMQRAVYIEENDTPEVLQKRVMEQAEWKILPESVELMCSGKIKIENGRTYRNE